MAAPLNSLLCKDAFQWNVTTDAAFNSLKKLLTSTPLLRLPNFNLPFTIETDARRTTGAVLQQEGHPIAFFSCAFHPLIQSSPYNREMCAIVESIKKWMHYLLGYKFTVLTDHSTLRHLLTQSIQTSSQQKWLRHLLGYHYEIKYCLGTLNSAPDVLSRRLEYCQSITMCSPSNNV